jgi:hypothetical protein
LEAASRFTGNASASPNTKAHSNGQRQPVWTAAPGSARNQNRSRYRLRRLFEELLDITLTYNHGHFDTVIVVTTIQDKATQKVANKHGAITVQTDLFKKNGRNFNKGAAINAAFSREQGNRGNRKSTDCPQITT